MSLSLGVWLKIRETQPSSSCYESWGSLWRLQLASTTSPWLSESVQITTHKCNLLGKRRQIFSTWSLLLLGFQFYDPLTRIKLERSRKMCPGKNQKLANELQKSVLRPSSTDFNSIHPSGLRVPNLSLESGNLNFLREKTTFGTLDDIIGVMFISLKWNKEAQSRVSGCTLGLERINKVPKIIWPDFPPVKS